MSNPKFQIWKSSVNDQYNFRLRAANDEIILSGESYTTKQGCQNGIDSVKLNASSDAQYERKTNGASYSFNLKARNNEIIGRSESYTTASARDNGIESVKKNAPTALVVDLT